MPIVPILVLIFVALIAVVFIYPKLKNSKWVDDKCNEFSEESDYSRTTGGLIHDSKSAKEALEIRKQDNADKIKEIKENSKHIDDYENADKEINDGVE